MSQLIPKGFRILKGKKFFDLSYKFIQQMDAMGFVPYQFPVIGYTSNWEQYEGDTNQFIMKDSKGRSMVLRPEITALVGRYFLQSGLNRFTCCYSEKCYRHEKSALNRYREFTQIGVESMSYVDEMQCIGVVCAAQAFIEPIIKNKLLVNFIDPSDKIWMDSIIKALTINEDKLSREALKNFKNKEYIQALDKSNHLEINTQYSLQNQVKYQRILKGLDVNNIRYTKCPNIVRGWNYYSGLVWENQVDKTTIIGGGGEYSNLFTNITKRKVYSAGFGFGLDRIINCLENKECIEGKDYKLIKLNQKMNFDKYIPIISNFIKNKKQYKYLQHEYDQD